MLTDFRFIRQTIGRSQHVPDTPVPMLPAELPVTFRLAYPDDDAAIARLAALDEEPMPTGAVLLGEVNGELWAAASIDGHGAVADPFRPSGELLFSLLHRAQRLRRATRRNASAGWHAPAAGRLGDQFGRLRRA